jgi:beta-lactamase regulating signal transducer with metallopeptidase domain
MFVRVGRRVRVGVRSPARIGFLTSLPFSIRFYSYSRSQLLLHSLHDHASSISRSSVMLTDDIDGLNTRQPTLAATLSCLRWIVEEVSATTFIILQRYNTKDMSQKTRKSKTRRRGETDKHAAIVHSFIRSFFNLKSNCESSSSCSL